MKFTLRLLSFFLLLSPIGSEAREVWRNPEVFQINREKAHSEFILHQHKEQALAPVNIDFPWSTPYYRNLNGKWDFIWYERHQEVPADWSDPSNDRLTWDRIEVPGTWQKQGYDHLYYLNNMMPFEFDMKTGKRAPEFDGEALENNVNEGFIQDEKQHVGCYRKWVEFSPEEIQNHVILRIGGAEAGYKVYVNGKMAGYSQDSMLPAEFDITPYIKEGKNLIGLEVYRWTDGSYMEVQDMIRYSGIYRDVYLRIEPQEHIRDIRFVGTPDENMEQTRVEYDVKIANTGRKTYKGGHVQFDLYSLDGEELVHSFTREVDPVRPGAEVAVKGFRVWNDLKFWSPDRPELYTLLVTLLDREGHGNQIARLDVGFKRFEQKDGNLYLNGKRFFIWGVNRHDHDHLTGKVIPAEHMVKDAVLMKQHNISTVRTSHYPNDERWYYLCNRYGIAMIDEANVESSRFSAYHEDLPGNRPNWQEAGIERVRNMVLRDQNNPAVLIWSLGNEQGFGWTDVFNSQYDEAKRIDPSRMVMCDRNFHPRGKKRKSMTKPDLYTPMYHAESQMNGYLKNRDTERRPFFMCEYRHAMGNAVGALDDFWNLVYENQENGVNGGCIWDWIDQGVLATDENGRKYYQYGGDWNDAYNEKNFCMNGLILPDQSITPKVIEVKKCYEPIKVKAVDLKKGKVEITNLFNQTNLSELRVLWELRENGMVTASGDLDPLDIRPGEKKIVKVDWGTPDPNKESYIRLSFQDLREKDWHYADNEITFAEFSLGGKYHYTYTDSDIAPNVTETADRITIAAGANCSLEFCRKTGVLASMSVNGTELLASNDQGCYLDNSVAWTDSHFRNKSGDCKLVDYDKLGLKNVQLSDQAHVQYSTEKNTVTVQIEHQYLNDRQIGYSEKQTWVIEGSGRVTVHEKIQPVGQGNRHVFVPRIGVGLQLAPAFRQVAYYGLGPGENYSDRKSASWHGIHRYDVEDNYTPYPKPQDCANREEVEWIQITNDEGLGIKVIAPQPLSMCVLPYSQKELSVSHLNEIPEGRTTSEFRISPKVCGIGNGSCGPLTFEPYRVYAEDTEFEFTILPKF